MRLRSSIILVAGLAILAWSGWSAHGGAAPSSASAPRGETVARLLASLESKAPPRVSHRIDGVNVADRCGSTQYYCNAPTPTCCWSQSKGYYCAIDVNHC
ncbi:MAG: hypothetical protein KGL11_02420 [Alphaproteobacteria bacterium]|nr:hypothetical protein [Alphaproteobacteria bacterium]